MSFFLFLKSFFSKHRILTTIILSITLLIIILILFVGFVDLKAKIKYDGCKKEEAIQKEKIPFCQRSEYSYCQVDYLSKTIISKVKDFIQIPISLIFSRDVLCSNCITLSDLMDPPSEDKPITLTPSELYLKENRNEERMRLAFYNPEKNVAFWRINVTSYGNIINNSLIKVTYNNKSFRLNSNKVTGYNIVFKTGKDAVNATLRMQGLSEEQIKSESSSTLLFSVVVCEAVCSDEEQKIYDYCKPGGVTYQKEAVIVLRK